VPKFLLNLLLQISKALVNSKIQFLIQKSFSLLSARPTLRPVRPLAQPAHRPRVGRVFAGNTFSFSDHAFPSRPPLPRLFVNRALPVKITPFPALTDHGQKFPRAFAPLRRCPAPRMPPSFYSPPSSLSPLNPLQTEL
jgi:hypothetical protein